MTTDQIISFLTLAKCQHLTYAADQLHMSQPALSYSLQKIEDEVGAPLFDRVGRGIKLNKNGELFLTYCEETLKSFETTRTLIHRQNDSLTHTINIFWDQKYAIDSNLVEFSDSNPDITLNLKKTNPDKIEEAVFNGSCDFGLIHTTNDQLSKSPYISIPTHYWYIALSSGDPLAQMDHQPRLYELKDKRFICLALDQMHVSFTERLCKKAGFDADVAYQSTSKFCLDMVCDRGWAFLSPVDDYELAIGNEYYRSRISFFPLSPEDYDSSLRFLFNSHRKLSESCQRLFDFIQMLPGTKIIG